MKIARLVKIAAFVFGLVSISGLAQARSLADEAAANEAANNAAQNAVAKKQRQTEKMTSLIPTEGHIISCTETNNAGYKNVMGYAFIKGYAFYGGSSKTGQYDFSGQKGKKYVKKGNTVTWIDSFDGGKMEFHVDSNTLYIKYSDGSIGKLPCIVAQNGHL